MSVFYNVPSLGKTQNGCLLSLRWCCLQASQQQHNRVRQRSPGSYKLWWLPSGHQAWQTALKATLLGVSINLDYWNMLVSDW